MSYKQLSTFYADKIIIIIITIIVNNTEGRARILEWPQNLRISEESHLRIFNKE